MDVCYLFDKLTKRKAELNLYSEFCDIFVLQGGYVYKLLLNELLICMSLYRATLIH